MPDEEDGGTEAEADAPAEPAPAKEAPKQSVTVEVMRPEPEQDRVLIVDFGSQVTQLIARRVREAGVYSRDRAVRQGRSRAGRERAARHHPLRRAGQRARDGHAARAASAVQCRRAGARHLLRRAGHGGGAGRGGRRRACPRIRPRRAADHRRDAAVRGRVQDRREGAGVDEPWRPRHAAAARLPRRRHLDRRAVRGDRRRFAAALRRAVPPRGGAHAGRRGAARQFRPPHRRLRRRLDHGAVPRQRGRPHPRAGRRGAGDLRAVGRRRFSRRRAADPRGDRRSAHLHLRRSRLAAAERGARGRRAVPRGITTSRWSRSMPPRASSMRWPASPTPR